MYPLLSVSTSNIPQQLDLRAKIRLYEAEVKRMWAEAGRAHGGRRLQGANLKGPSKKDIYNKAAKLVGLGSGPTAIRLKRIFREGCTDYLKVFSFPRWNVSYVDLI